MLPKNRFALLQFVLLGATLLCLTRGVLAETADEFFEKRVRPVFVEHCYSCHSLSAKKEKGGLRLDAREAMIAGGSTGPAIVPGKPEASLLVAAIKKVDPDLAMPPKGASLTPQAIQDIEKWIKDGAAFPASLAAVKKNPAATHWAFQPVKTSPPPAVRNAAWSRSEIDRFILAKIEAAKIEPAPDARPEVLARRMVLMLTGLPPTPEEIDAFVTSHKKEGNSATAKLVDALLASPQFGERWARHWMDLTRYADSAGHENDYEIEGAWQYRDYLVRALNSDLPYDQFVREQIAGDIMPPRIDSESGRNESMLATMWWHLGERGFSPLDLATEEAERFENKIEVFGKTFNAMTIGCARCHDHKFDPISAREYYGIFGMLKASPMRRTWSNDAEFERAAVKLRALRDKSDAALKSETQEIKVSAEPFVIPKSKVIADFANGVPAGWLTAGHTEVVTAQSAPLRGLMPGLWSGTLSRRLPASVRSPSFIIEDDFVHVLAAGEEAMVQVIIANHQTIREPIYNGLKLKLSTGIAAWHWRKFSIGRWKGERAHIEVFTGTIHNQDRLLKTVDSTSSQFGVRAVVLNSSNVPAAPPGACASGLPRLEWPAALATEFQTVESGIPKPERYLAMDDLDGADIPVQLRGDPRKPREGPAPRRYLEVCGTSVTPKSGSGRRELAEALLAPANPLTSRVIVNRLWHYLFGRGLVRSVDNFGLSGESPSHPELLDYLAHRFVHEHRWSLKRMIREIVLTRTWQLASAPPLVADAENKLLSRYSLRRLEAEAIRDSILNIAGTLDRKFGGPVIPVRHTLKGTLTNGIDPPSGPIDGQRRRSIYLAVWRNYPNTFMDLFDKPPPGNTYGSRDVSNVPAQALALLNDPFVSEQAKNWAQRIRKSGLQGPQRIERMYREAFSRLPTSGEVQQAVALVGNDEAGWDELALALINLKEFIYVQ